MKRRLLISLALITVLLACNNGEQTVPESTAPAPDSSRQTAQQDSIPVVAALPQDSAKAAVHKPFADLPGNWALVGDDNTTFVIEAKKITYPSTFKSYKYTIKGDSLKIRYDDYEGSFYMAMKGHDTLVLTGDEKQVYYRIKQ